MKRYLKDIDNWIGSLNIVAIILADDVESYIPRFDIYGSKQINYNELTDWQLSTIPEKELRKIKDPRVLRRLPKEKLDFVQINILRNANSENMVDNISVVKKVLKAIRNCEDVYRTNSKKNQNFAKYLKDNGIILRDEDVINILHQLHVKDYSYSTISYDDNHWNSTLMVFEFNGNYQFMKVIDPAKAANLAKVDSYIKLDTDKLKNESECVVSFHDPEFTLKHPYSNYPLNKEDIN